MIDQGGSRGLLLNERGLGKRLTGEDRGLQKGGRRLSRIRRDRAKFFAAEISHCIAAADTFDPDHMIPTPTEADVFKALRVSYVSISSLQEQTRRQLGIDKWYPSCRTGPAGETQLPVWPAYPARVPAEC